MLHNHGQSCSCLASSSPRFYRFLLRNKCFLSHRFGIKDLLTESPCKMSLSSSTLRKRPDNLFLFATPSFFETLGGVFGVSEDCVSDWGTEMFSGVVVGVSENCVSDSGTEMFSGLRGISLPESKLQSSRQEGGVVGGNEGFPLSFTGDGISSIKFGEGMSTSIGEDVLQPVGISYHFQLREQNDPAARSCLVVEESSHPFESTSRILCCNIYVSVFVFLARQWYSTYAHSSQAFR